MYKVKKKGRVKRVWTTDWDQIKMTGQWHTSRSNVTSQLRLSLTDNFYFANTPQSQTSSHLHEHYPSRIYQTTPPHPFLAILFSPLLFDSPRQRPYLLQWTIVALSLSFNFADLPTECPIPAIRCGMILTPLVLLALVVPGTSWCHRRSSRSQGRPASRSLLVLVRRRFLSLLFCSQMLRSV